MTRRKKIGQLALEVSPRARAEVSQSTSTSTSDALPANARPSGVRRRASSRAATAAANALPKDARIRDAFRAARRAAESDSSAEELAEECGRIAARARLELEEAAAVEGVAIDWRKKIQSRQ